MAKRWSARTWGGPGWRAPPEGRRCGRPTYRWAGERCPTGAGKASAPALPGDDDAGRLGGLGRGRAVAGQAAGRGTPLSWQGNAGEPAPVLQLVPAEARRSRVALAVSAQWLGLLGLAWAVS